MDNGIGAITSAQLTLIVVLVLLVAFGLWWSTRRRAQRREVAPPEPAVAPPSRSLANDEPIPASAPLEANPAAQAADEQIVPPPAAPAPEAKPAPAAKPAPPADSLADAPVTLIKGLGPKVAARLGEHGITHVGQLAALSDAEVAALDAKLGNFTGRMARDRWLEQARLLAAGDRAGFEATFGKLG